MAGWEVVKRYFLRIAAAVAATLLLSTGCTTPRSALTGLPAPTVCTQHSVSVTLSDADPTAYNVVGWLCVARDDRQGARTVQLLVSGLTFDHTYWDTSYQPDTYSYVRAAARAGFTTFNFDRIGIGKSTRPLDTEVTIPSLNIKRALPLNQPVDVEFTPAKGEIGFVCGMGMLKGTIVVQ